MYSLLFFFGFIYQSHSYKFYLENYEENVQCWSLKGAREN